jgi:hypothetical protein
MSTTNPLPPPQTRYKTSVAAISKKPQKDPPSADTSSSDIRTKEQAVTFLTSKDYLTPGNPINLQVLAHALSQLGSAANKMPKALTDGISSIVVLINDYAAQQLANEIVATVKAQLQEHIDSFSTNVETMRDAVEHVTNAAKEITGKLNEFGDGFQESAEQLAQATHELTEKTADKMADNPTTKAVGIDQYLKSYANATRQQIPPAHEAIIAKGDQSAKQILIRKDPKSTDNALASLSEKELVAKANATLDLMDTESLEMPPGTTFVGAKKLRNGNVLYQLNTSDAGNWIKREDVQKEFMENYGGTANMQNKLHYVIAEFVPVTFIENSTFMHAKIEEESSISADTLTFSESKYIKPAHLRKNNQKVAHVTFGFNDRHAANTAIQAGLFVEGKHVSVRKKLTEPRRCLKCQKFGHFVPDCKADVDTCARCSGQHRTSACDITNTVDFSCSNCVGANAKGHGAADRNCPAFKTESDRILNRAPDNNYKYFPTSVPRTWLLLNEPDTHIMHYPQTQSNETRPDATHPSSQQNSQGGWKTTRRGKTADTLTYQDRHYVPFPRTDTYIPDSGWPPKATQSTLDGYVNHTGTSSQARQIPENAPPPPASQVSTLNSAPREKSQATPPTRSQSTESLQYA